MNRYNSTELALRGESVGYKKPHCALLLQSGNAKRKQVAD